MTELQAVNLILRNAGLGEVAALDASDSASDAAQAQRVLEEIDLEVQADGWYYNIRSDVQLTRESDQTVVVPASAITIDTYGRSGHLDAAPIGGNLVLVEDGDTTWDTDPYVTYTLRYDFGCIPFPVRNYIAWYAALRFLEGQPQAQNTRIGQRDYERRLNLTERRMIDARALARRLDSQNRDGSAFDSTHVFNVVGHRVPTRFWP